MFSLSTHKNRKLGFTLIEMMVATALFIIVALIITGSLMMVLQSYRKVQSAKLAMDNLSFAMDNMILRLRDGSDYVGASAVSGSAITYRGIAFTDSTGVGVQFKYNETEKSLEKCDRDGTSNCITLTAPEAQITDLRFYLPNVNLATQRPLVTIFVRGIAGSKEGSRTAFALQTTVSQRNARPLNP
ncbi:MAG: type II secretion system protein [bacterium]